MKTLVVAISISVVGLFGLTACGETSEELVQSGSAAGTETPAAEEITSEGPEVVEEELTFENQTECLLGDWEVDNENAGALFSGATDEAFSAGITVEELVGTTIVTFSADGKLVTDYSGWAIHAETPEGPLALKRDGTDRGTYSATNAGDISMSVTEMGAIVTLEIMGNSFSDTGTPDSMTGTYACDANTLKITARDDLTVLFR